MEKTITKEQLQESLKNIDAAKRKGKDVLEKCTVSQKELDQVRNTTLVELAKLEGEERAIKHLLKLCTVEPTKEPEQK